MQHLLDLVVSIFDAKRQWYSGEQVTVLGNDARRFYLKNSGGVIHLWFSEDNENLMNRFSSVELPIALLNPYKGCWELTPAILDQWEPWCALTTKSYKAHLERIRPRVPGPVLKYLGPDGSHAASSGKESCYQGCKTWAERKAINLAAAAA